MSDFRELDPLLHAQLRLSVMSILISLKSATFTFLLEKTGATRGNLSIQIKKLEAAGYLEVDKRFRDNYPQTTCRITDRGVTAFEAYVDALRDYLGHS
jgi:DNA-binding transcriptional ArsR family regulator